MPDLIENQGIDDAELMQKIRVALANYSGDSDDITAAIGLLVMAHLMGWRYARLVLSRKAWKEANNLFGDLKKFIKKDTEFTRKSFGLKLVNSLEEFWGYVRGNREAMPLKDKKRLDIA